MSQAGEVSKEQTTWALECRDSGFLPRALGSHGRRFLTWRDSPNIPRSSEDKLHEQPELTALAASNADSVSIRVLLRIKQHKCTQAPTPLLTLLTPASPELASGTCEPAFTSLCPQTHIQKEYLVLHGFRLSINVVILCGSYNFLFFFFWLTYPRLALRF